MGKLRQLRSFNQIGRGKHYKKITSRMGILIIPLLIPLFCVGWVLYWLGA